MSIKKISNTKISGFTLLELAIVMLLIGIIIAGIMQGANIVTSSRLASARSITSKASFTSYQGLIAWFESSSKDSFKKNEVINLANISEWQDISPSSLNAKKNKLSKTANSNLFYNIAGINKIPSLSFKNNERISLNNFYQGKLSQATICIAFRPNFSPTSNPAVLIDSATGQSRFSIAIKNNAVNINAGNDANTQSANNPASFINGREYILCAYVNSSQSGAYVNDALNLAGQSLIDAGNNAMTGLTIGSENSGANGFSGEIAEVIIFNRVLKLQERRDIMLYLSSKYRIAIVS